MICVTRPRVSLAVWRFLHVSILTISRDRKDPWQLPSWYRRWSLGLKPLKLYCYLLNCHNPPLYARIGTTKAYLMQTLILHCGRHSSNIGRRDQWLGEVKLYTAAGIPSMNRYDGSVINLDHTTKSCIDAHEGLFPKILQGHFREPNPHQSGGNLCQGGLKVWLPFGHCEVVAEDDPRSTFKHTVVICFREKMVYKKSLL